MQSMLDRLKVLEQTIVHCVHLLYAGHVAWAAVHIAMNLILFI